MKFYELAVGARFVVRGEPYVKIAMSMAESPDGTGHVFMGAVPVEAEEGAPVLSPAEAAKWKPDERPWWECIGRAPGERGTVVEG
jgi:hypothetical protein